MIHIERRQWPAVGVNHENGSSSLNTAIHSFCTAADVNRRESAEAGAHRCPFYCDFQCLQKRTNAVPGESSRHFTRRRSFCAVRNALGSALLRFGAAQVESTSKETVPRTESGQQNATAAETDILLSFQWNWLPLRRCVGHRASVFLFLLPSPARVLLKLPAADCSRAP